ncbi:MAG: TauD/TfdA family dioxygenase [Dongiaceae bacterium]
MTVDPAATTTTLALPATPDFDSWPVAELPVAAEPIEHGVSVRWNDGLETRFHAMWLRENAPEDIHPVTREPALMLDAIPDDLAARAAAVEPGGILRIDWSSGETSRYHPGWLRAHAIEAGSDPLAMPPRTFWGAGLGGCLPRFDGAAILAGDAAELAGWLEALHIFGVGLLEGLPLEPDALERIATTIGPIRPTNFGDVFEVRSKPDADSNAYTSMALPMHTDLATREYKPGLQFLFCMANAAAGGENQIADGFMIAETMRREVPDLFRTASAMKLTYGSRARDSDYRFACPMIRLAPDGTIEEVRVSPWLRAPLVAPLKDVDRAYRALRYFLAVSQRPVMHVTLKLKPGDLLSFDNRRILHGRTGYDPASGERWLRGCYVEREDLHSRLRILARERRARAIAGEPAGI